VNRLPALVALVALVAGLLAPAATADAPGPCGAAEIITGCGTRTNSDFRGAIYVPGSAAANGVVARTNGCAGCVWTLVLHCDRNTVQDPAYVNCNAARCPDGSWFRLYLQRPTDDHPVDVDLVCLTATRRVVTAAELAVDAARYLTSVRPPPTAIAVQPEGRAVTGKATFFAASAPRPGPTTLTAATPAGPATLTLTIEPARYAWEFGDGATCETPEPGGTYDGTPPRERCDDRVAHVYRAAATYPVRLRTTWAGTYTFDVGFGPVGPVPIPGDGVEAPETVRDLLVREGRAVLVGR
jgi:hypothetical protein